MLLVRSESAPMIHLSLKFLELCILSLNLQHTIHHNATTSFLPEVTQSSHVIDLISLSKSRCHFLKVSNCMVHFLHLPLSLSSCLSPLSLYKWACLRFIFGVFTRLNFLSGSHNCTIIFRVAIAVICTENGRQPHVILNPGY